MQFLIEYGLFLAKAATIFAAVLIAVGSLAAVSMRQRKFAEQPHLEVTLLNKEYEDMEQALNGVLLSPREFKQKLKAQKKSDKAEAKADRKAAKKNKKTKNADDDAGTVAGKPKKRIFVLDFNGDLHATAVPWLCREISAILTMARDEDEVVLRLESPGGAVHGYGLAASQLQRIRERKIPLTIAVDKIAASGGYMMACVSDKIIAAPFAFIGSIGVIMQIPNVHRLLKKHDIDYELLVAGEYKRTLTLFGENTDKGRKKMTEEMEETHRLFKEHVKAQRPGLDIEKVATGEHWLGTRALELGLVDHLQTSDDYLMAARQDAQLIRLSHAKKKSFFERLTSKASLDHSALTEGLGRPMLL